MRIIMSIVMSINFINHAKHTNVWGDFRQIGWELSVSKSDQLHAHSFQFSSIDLRNNP